MYPALPRVLLASYFPAVVSAAAIAFAICPAAAQAPAFAAAGVESYQATGQILFQLGIMKPQLVNLNGSLVFKRSAPGDSNRNGKRDVRTEVVALDLKGSAPGVGIIQVVARPDKVSPGLVEARGRTDYPAATTFDVILTVRTPYGPVIADQPIRLSGAIPKPPAVNVNLAMVGRTGALLYYVTPGGPFAVGQITKMTAKTLAEIPNPPPLGGFDCFPTTASLEMDVPDSDGAIDREAVRLTGTTMVKRSDPRDADGNGRWEIATEIVAMDLVGESARMRQPLVLSVDPRPDHASLGRIEPRANGQNFPADSFFDIFVGVESTSGVVLVNEEKARLVAAGGIDSFPPGSRPFVVPLATDVRDPSGEVVGSSTALTLVFGNPVACPSSLMEVAAGDDRLTSAIATVELELPQLGAGNPIPATLSGPLTIHRAPPADPDGAGAEPPRIGTQIIDLDLRGTARDEQGHDVPVQLVIAHDPTTGVARAIPGIITQIRPDAALPATSFFDLALEVRVGSGGSQRCYRTVDPIRLAGIIQAIPGRTPLCASSDLAPTGPVDMTVVACSGSETGTGILRWGCLLPR